MLVKTPEEIKMGEVIRLIEGSIAPMDCVNNMSICERSDTYAVRNYCLFAILDPLY